MKIKRKPYEDLLTCITCSNFKSHKIITYSTQPYVTKIAIRLFLLHTHNGIHVNCFKKDEKWFHYDSNKKNSHRDVHVSCRAIMNTVATQTDEKKSTPQLGPKRRKKTPLKIHRRKLAYSINRFKTLIEWASSILCSNLPLFFRRPYWQFLVCLSKNA